MSKDVDLRHLPRNQSDNYQKQLLDTATKTGPNALKAGSKKVVHKAAEVTDEFTGNKNAYKIVKQKI